MNEREAIRRLKQGDIQGLEVLVRAYQVEAVRAANMIIRDPTRAEDVVQDVFLRVYRRIDRFDSERPFRPWFMRIVVNEAYRVTTSTPTLSLQEPMNGHQHTLEDMLEADAPLPPEIFEAQETRQALWDALGKLTPIERSMLAMRYFLDFREREVAEALDCPVGTVKWRLHQARKTLKMHLEPMLKI